MAHSDGFFVDPEALSGAHADIGRLLGDMAGFTLDSDHSPSVFGDDELAESAQEFHERWKGGIEELAGETETIHRRLGETISEYRRVDEESAALIEELGDDDGGRTGPGKSGTHLGDGRLAHHDGDGVRGHRQGIPEH